MAEAGRWSGALRWLALLVLSAPAFAADFAALRAERAAIERVYHAHRTGTKPAFEEAMPVALLERLVRADLKKAAVLARVYGVKVTGAMVEPLFEGV